MARHLLSARQVQVAREGDTFDGDGLILRVRDGRAAWVLRYTAPTGKRRELGLGGADRASIEAAGASLTRARKAAEEVREELACGIDPIDARRAEHEARREATSQAKAQADAAGTTLRGYARIYHEKHVEPLRTVKHAQQWINSIEQHVPASLLDTSIDRVTAVDLLDELVPILRKVPETGSRIYQRLATIFNAAVIDGLRADNPAMPIRGELQRRAGRRERRNYASMPYRQVPAFMQRLQEAPGTSPRCLEFAILAAARTGEALTAEWAEFEVSELLLLRQVRPEHRKRGHPVDAFLSWRQFVHPARVLHNGRQQAVGFDPRHRRSDAGVRQLSNVL